MGKRKQGSTQDTVKPAKVGRTSQGEGADARNDDRAGSISERPENATPGKGRGMFEGVRAGMVEGGINARRVEIWRRRLSDLGGTVVDTRKGQSLPADLTHVLATSWARLADWLGAPPAEVAEKEESMVYLSYDWVQDCLQEGRIVPVQGYFLAHAPSISSESDERLLPPSAGDEKLLKPHSGGSPSLLKPKEAETSEMEVASSHGSFDSGVEEHHTSGQQLHNTSHEIIDMPADTTAKMDAVAVPDLNTHITGPFKELMHIYDDALGDDRRYFSYYKAVSQIEKLPFRVINVDQVKNLPGIGPSIRSHVQEIISMGKLEKLKQFKSNEKVRTLALFGSVWGIGPATAKKLYEVGHRTLEHLEKDPSLTTAQRIALKYLDDINTRIPREKVVEMEAIIQKVAQEVRPGISVICGGSYRRGKATVGDMDMVVTHPDGKSHAGFLQALIKRLKEIDFITEDLMVGHPHSVEGTDSGVDTYFGLCRHPDSQQRHRIDFKVYPRDQYAFGLLAWTGNDVLNRRLRLLAEEKGYKLDDHGLFRATPRKGGTGGERHRSQVSVACSIERDVFDILAFPWLEPNERNL